MEVLTKSKKPSQKELIQKALERGGNLTGLDIVMRFGCLNYRARISELRSNGLPVQSKMIRKGDKHYSLYYIER